MILSARTLHTPSVVAGDRWARDAPMELHAAHKHMASTPLPSGACEEIVTQHFTLA